MIIEIGNYTCVAICEDEIERAALLACTGPGDAEPAISELLRIFSPTFNIAALDENGELQTRPATNAELRVAAECQYEFSVTGFSDPETAKKYLIWQAAHEELWIDAAEISEDEK